MKTVTDFRRRKEPNAVADLFRAILLSIWGVVRVPILVILAFLEPFVRLLLVGIAILSLLTGLVYLGASSPAPIPFWLMVSVSVGCLLLIPAYHFMLRLFSR